MMHGLLMKSDLISLSFFCLSMVRTVSVKAVMMTRVNRMAAIISGHEICPGGWLIGTVHQVSGLAAGTISGGRQSAKRG